MKGFSEQEARELVGSVVVKRVLSPEDPAVQPGHVGRVVLYQRSETAEGFAVLVLWGKDELWQYNTSEDFEADARIDVPSPIRRY